MAKSNINASAEQSNKNTKFNNNNNTNENLNKFGFVECERIFSISGKEFSKEIISRLKATEKGSILQIASLSYEENGYHIEMHITKHSVSAWLFKGDKNHMVNRLVEEYEGAKQSYEVLADKVEEFFSELNLYKFESYMENAE